MTGVQTCALPILNFSGIVSTISHSELSRIWFFDDINNRFHFLKQFFGGAFITIVMTGLDQDQMQKNLSCRSYSDAKKNMYWYGFAFLPVNLLFLSLGVLLYKFAEVKGISIPAQTDNLFPIIATQGYISPVVGILFVLGLISAAYSSADSALTALTTSFTIDILNTKDMDEATLQKVRKRVHLMISAVVVAVILIFNAFNDRSVIDSIFTVAGYTYGPLLGLYAFGMFTRFQTNDKLVPLIALLSPIICLLLSTYSKELFGGYEFGFELVILNGLLTFTGLYFTRRKGVKIPKV